MRRLLALAAALLVCAGPHATTPQQIVSGFQPVVAVASDTFVRANSSTLGANWSTITSGVSCSIASNLVQDQSLSNFCGNVWTGVGSWATNQCSGAQIETLNDANAVMGTAVRMSTSAFTGYVGYLIGPLSAPSVQIVKYSAGTSTNILSATAVGQALTAGDGLGTCAYGTTITVFIELATSNLYWNVTDSSISSGNPGLVIVGSLGGAVGDAQFGEWVGFNAFSTPIQ